MYTNISEHIRTYKNMKKHKRKYRNIKEDIRTYNNISDSSCINNNVPVHYSARRLSITRSGHSHKSPCAPIQILTQHCGFNTKIVYREYYGL